MTKKVRNITKFEREQMETVFDGVKCITTSTGGANDSNNLYIVEGDDYAAVIDPGYEAASAANIEDLIEQSHENKPIKYILLTDWYEEHWSGASSIKTITNGTIISSEYDSARINRDSKTELIDEHLVDGGIIDLGGRKLKKIDTPGHTPGSSCYLIQNEGILFSGDCILPNTSTAIDPDEGGDMSDYVESLRKIQASEVNRILSFHGKPIESPKKRLENLIKIREDRDTQILGMLSVNPGSVETIWESIYGERNLTGYLLEASKKQIEAHIIKLETEKKLNKLTQGHLTTYQTISNSR